MSGKYQTRDLKKCKMVVPEVKVNEGRWKSVWKWV
jgi:hypothetical protein